MEKRTRFSRSRLTAVELIGSVRAVCFSVTPPAAVDTVPRPTPEVVGATRQRRLLRLLPSAVLGPLVGAVGTVHVAVAEPQDGDTDQVVALEGGGAAGAFGAGLLVRAVGAVVLIVTDKHLGDALAVGALELVVLALCRSCDEAKWRELNE